MATADFDLDRVHPANRPRYVEAYARQQAEVACQAAAERIAYSASEDDRQAARQEVRKNGWTFCRTNDVLQPLFEFLDCCATQSVPLAGLGQKLLRAISHFLGSGVLVEEGGSVSMDADVAREWPQQRNLLALLMRDDFVRHPEAAPSLPESQPVPESAYSESVAAILMAGESCPAVEDIAANPDLSSEQKGRKIIAVFSPAAEWSSEGWGTLLGISDSRVRQLSWWRELRAAKNKQD